MSKHRATTRTEDTIAGVAVLLDRHELTLDRACAAAAGAVVSLVGVAVAVVVATY